MVDLFLQAASTKKIRKLKRRKKSQKKKFDKFMIDFKDDINNFKEVGE